MPIIILLRIYIFLSAENSFVKRVFSLFLSFSSLSLFLRLSNVGISGIIICGTMKFQKMKNEKAETEKKC